MSRDEHELARMARDLPTSQRDGYLARVCGDDPTLLARVIALMSQHSVPDAETIGQGEAPTTASEPGSASLANEGAGDRIGRYKLLQPIGEGGFGTVWMAEQREPVKRRVALKVIKLGMDTKQVIARFEAERQALAMMDHPHIAKVLDAGSTDLGRPYFVMEYIKGIPIIEYCDTEKLDTEARLRLFIQVCNAIQHAHQKGIIHRDIKPSNILVTLHDGIPVCKVIDFGIAKATANDLTQKTLFTEHRQLIGTPAYMSPEQAEMSGLDIDTRTDIYALGVLLYELLTGTTPFDTEVLMQAGFGEMVRIIREEEPRKPSTKLSSLGETATRTAQQRRVDVRQLNSLLRGDLDWIVMKCLEKDRTRRYETANALALDVERHLHDEPVLAGPPSSGYKLRKFIRRNKGQVVATVVLVGAIVLGLAGTSYGLAWALRERDRAEAAAITAETARTASERERIAADRARRDAEAQLARSEEFKGFMVELLDSIEPDPEFPEGSLAIRELLDTAYAKILSGDIRNPAARAEIIDLLDTTASRHNWFDLRIQLGYARLDEAVRLYGREDPSTRSAVLALASGLLSEGRAREAFEVIDEYIPDIDERLESGEASLEQLWLRGIVADVRRLYGAYGPALEGHERALAMARELDEPVFEYYHQIMSSRLLWRLGRLEESLQVSDAARPAFEALRNAALLDGTAGTAEATPRALAIHAVLEDVGSWYADSWFAYRADLMMDLERHAEALELYLEAERVRALESPDDFTRHIWGAGAGRALRSLGRLPEALSKSKQALRGMRVTRAPVGVQRDVSRQILTMLAEMGRDAEHDQVLAEFLDPPAQPLVVFADGADLPYQPSGFMGEIDKAGFRSLSRESPYEGERCFEWRVEPGDSWAAMGWMEPADNWGDLPGGYNLTGAGRLSFAARGKAGGEVVNVGIGLIDTGDYQDTLKERMRIELTREWTRYEIPLEGLDLSTVRTGFVIESELTDEPQTIYFDDIRFE